MITDRVQKDDIRYALTQLMSFFDKEVDDRLWKFWWAVLKRLPYDNCMRALREYLAEGKYAPRPANIVEIAKRYPVPDVDKGNLYNPAVHQTDCDPTVARAWMWFISMSSADSALFKDGLFSDKKVDDNTQQKYLQIVNAEAKRLNAPDSIPDEYKLIEIWG